MSDNKQKSGFFPISPWGAPCSNPEHNPPMHLHIPPGQAYRHVCPQCGRQAILIPPQITC